LVASSRLSWKREESFASSPLHLQEALFLRRGQFRAAEAEIAQLVLDETLARAREIRECR
jgi:hypothetical protein